VPTAAGRTPGKNRNSENEGFEEDGFVLVWFRGLSVECGIRQGVQSRKLIRPHR
jgi:hypothetical protein